jgi:hypothetical protein
MPIGSRSKFFFSIVLTSFATASYSQLPQSTGLEKAKQTLSATWKCSFGKSGVFIDIDQNKKVSGVGFEIMDAFARHVLNVYKIKAEIIYDEPTGTTTELLDKIKSSADGTFGVYFIAPSPEREKRYALTHPLFTLPVYLATFTKIPELVTKEDVQKLGGYNAYVYKDSYYDVEFTRIQKEYSIPLNIIRYESRLGYKDPEIINQLKKDSKSVTFVDVSHIRDLKKLGLDPQLHKALQFGIPRVLVVSDKNTWKKDFNDFLRSYTRSSEYKQMLIRIMGQAQYSTLDLPD